MINAIKDIKDKININFILRIYLLFLDKKNRIEVIFNLNKDYIIKTYILF